MNVTIPEELVEGLEDAASVAGSSVSDVVREAVSRFLFEGHWRGVAEVAEAVILDGGTNDEALEAVFKSHPGAATTQRSISWYRSRLRKDHPTVLTDAEVRRARDRGAAKPARRK
jgi:Arc/MetJ-type ribon-helix-helix transcriptional regulator